MNTRNAYLLIGLLCFAFSTYSQTKDNPTPPRPSFVNLGIGAGLDYGGFGVCLSVLPDPHFAIFGGGGYALAGLGYNIGGQVRFNPENRFCVTSGYMYGYNGAIHGGTAGVNKIYYGSSIFIGGDIRSKTRPENFLSLKIIIPFHDPAFQNDINYYNSMGANLPNPSPINFSLGYHVGF